MSAEESEWDDMLKRIAKLKKIIQDKEVIPDEKSKNLQERLSKIRQKIDPGVQEIVPDAGVEPQGGRAKVVIHAVPSGSGYEDSTAFMRSEQDPTYIVHSLQNVAGLDVGDTVSTNVVDALNSRVDIDCVLQRGDA